ncbi:hypothetical protein J6590_095465 [Homalodisca vitripennis]|nr:hypothetical protein J6590_095465 [Homalodisca vitripennis]
MPRIALEKEERGRRPRGRPRGRWEDQVWKDIERRGLQKIQVEEEETWNDRQKWRRLCTTTRDNGNNSFNKELHKPGDVTTYSKDELVNSLRIPPERWLLRWIIPGGSVVELVIGYDPNSHSKMWGSTNTNSTGELAGNLTSPTVISLDLSCPVINWRRSKAAFGEVLNWPL